MLNLKTYQKILIFVVGIVFYTWIVLDVNRKVNNLTHKSQTKQVTAPQPVYTDTQREQILADKTMTYFKEEILSQSNLADQIKKNKIVKVFTINDSSGRRFDLVDTIADEKQNLHEWFWVAGQNSVQIKTNKYAGAITDYVIPSWNQVKSPKPTIDQKAQNNKKAIEDQPIWDRITPSPSIPDKLIIYFTRNSDGEKSTAIYNVATWQQVKMVGPTAIDQKTAKPGVYGFDLGMEYTADMSTEDGNLVRYDDIELVGDNEYFVVKYDLLGNKRNVYLVFSLKTGRVIDKIEFDRRSVL